MSLCEQPSTKDRVVFITKKDFDENPSKIQLPELPEDQQQRGLILPNGDINFDCPCLGGMASGPCGYEFREAFSCYHYSTSEVKASECVDKFIQMQNCMSKYPNLYPNENAAMNSMEPTDVEPVQFSNSSEPPAQQQIEDKDKMQK